MHNLAATEKRPTGRPKRAELEKLEILLLNVALAEFLDKGYAGASLTAIVKKAQISKTTLYSRYTSKEELFSAIVSKQFKTLSSEVLFNSGYATLSLPQALAIYGNHILEISFRDSNANINRLIYAESHKFPQLSRSLQERAQAGVNSVAALIKSKTSEDAFLSQKSFEAAEVFLMAIRGWYVTQVVNNISVVPESREQWVIQVVDMTLSSYID